MQLRTDGEDSHKQENISILDLNYSIIGIKWLVSVSNHRTIPLKGSHSKTAVFSMVKITKNLFSHTATLPTCPEKFDLGKYVTSTRQR